MGPYLIASRKRTLKSHRYITFWRPNRCGYAWSLPWAGRYDAAEAQSLNDDPAGLYRDEHSYAVPMAALEPLMVAPRAGDIDGDVGPVLRNTKAHWAVIEAHAAALRNAEPIHRRDGDEG